MRRIMDFKHAVSLGLAMLMTSVAVGAQDGKNWSLGVVEIEQQGQFYVGGQYDDPANPTFMAGQMYVHFQIPAAKGRGQAPTYPIVMIHGGGPTTTFTGTPDGRPGWADYFLKQGWPVYVVDQPGRGRTPYIESVYGPRAMPSSVSSVTASETWPQAVRHTQWPGAGVPGDYAFDQFVASRVVGMATGPQEEVTSKALIALLDKIGPAVLLTHSQSGPHGWETADARPNLVKALLVVEPNGPPFYNDDNTNVDRPWGITRLPLAFDPPAREPAQLGTVQEAQPQGAGLYRCWAQTTPARRLPRLAAIPILLVTGEASFRAQYDHCTSQFLTQAGVPNDHVRLETVGIRGNGHFMMLEKNNLEIAAYMERWLREKLAKQMRSRR